MGNSRNASADPKRVLILSDIFSSRPICFQDARKKKVCGTVKTMFSLFLNISIEKYLHLILVHYAQVNKGMYYAMYFVLFLHLVLCDDLCR